jgi:hypothetical protein
MIILKNSWNDSFPIPLVLEHEIQSSPIDNIKKVFFIDYTNKLMKPHQ